MQWLLNIRLRYKFWLVNSVSFAIALALVLCAMYIHTQSVQERDAEHARSRTVSWGEVLAQVPKEKIEGLIRGDWFAIDRSNGQVWGPAAQGVPNSLLTQLKAGTQSQVSLELLEPQLTDVSTPGYWIASLYVQDHDLILGLKLETASLARTFMAQASNYAAVVAVLMLVLLAVSQALISFIESHINRLREVMLRVQNEHDLTLSVAIECRDEIGQMSEAFNQMQSGYRNTVRNIRDSAAHLSQEVSQLMLAAAETNEQMTRQQGETEQVATAMQQMTGAAHEVAQNAAGTHEISEVANAKVQAGNLSVQETQNAILQLSDQILAASHLIEQLNESGQRIEQATGQMQTISDQTNLLALNAAIEAARAGSVGRGFAVVAEEVRNLAHHAHDASEAINQVVDEIRSVAAQVTAFMESSRGMTVQCVDKAEDAAVALQDISQVVEQIKDKNLMIATAAEEQSQVSETISEGLQAIREETLKTTDNAGAVLQSGEAIKQQAQRLVTLVEAMKV